MNVYKDYHLDIFINGKKVSNKACSPLKIFYHTIMEIKQHYFNGKNLDTEGPRKRFYREFLFIVELIYNQLLMNNECQFDSEDFGVSYSLYFKEIGQMAKDYIKIVSQSANT